MPIATAFVVTARPQSLIRFGANDELVVSWTPEAN
jgi:hypothetical protein